MKGAEEVELDNEREEEKSVVISSERSTRGGSEKNEYDDEILEPAENENNDLKFSVPPPIQQIEVDIEEHNSPRRTAAGTAYALARSLRAMISSKRS